MLLLIDTVGNETRKNNRKIDVFMRVYYSRI
jgi:hypothetical protein